MSDHDVVRLLVVTGLLVAVRLARLLSGSYEVRGWLGAIPRFGWWASVAILCVFVSGLRGTGWTLGAAELILGSSLLLILSSRRLTPTSSD